NKADRPGADLFIKNLRSMLAPAFSNHDDVPVIKTIASEKDGIGQLYDIIEKKMSAQRPNNMRSWLLAEKAWQLIQNKRMKGMNKQELKAEIEILSAAPGFNLYKYVTDKS